MSRSAIVAILLVLLVSGACVRLGFWQLDRLEQRREQNARQEAALALPSLVLAGDALAEAVRAPERFAYRRVRLRGAYDPAIDVIVRGRALDGQPGVQLLTPFYLPDGGGAILVNRGWAPSPDASTIDPRPLGERGAREIDAIVQPVPAVEGELRMLVTEMNGSRVLSTQRLDLASLRDRLAIPILPLYLHQLPGPRDPPLPVRLPLPEFRDEGPHLGYAIQWFSFALIAVGGLLVAGLRGRGR